MPSLARRGYAAQLAKVRCLSADPDRDHVSLCDEVLACHREVGAGGYEALEYLDQAVVRDEFFDAVEVMFVQRRSEEPVDDRLGICRGHLQAPTFAAGAR